MPWPDPEGRTLEQAQAEWDALDEAEVGDKGPRPTENPEVPEGMTPDEFYGRSDPRPGDPLAGGE